MARDRAVEGMEERDRRLAHELAAGVLRRRGDLDNALAPYAEHGWESVNPKLRDLLRLGAYQLLELDKVPAHAAVGTSTELAKKIVGERAAKFVNAMLRKLSTNGAPSGSDAGSRRSHPAWLILRWDARFGVDGTRDLLLWNDTPPPLVVQPARWTAEQLESAFRAEGLHVRTAPFGAGLVVEGRTPTALPGYTEGGFIVQDPAQAMVARFAAIPEGATIYDACAAPGGKTISIGRAVGRSGGRILAADANVARTRKLRGNLQRAGSGREFVLAADAAAPPCRPMDAALLDAPCLGTGTFARHPDARGKVSVRSLEVIVEKQRELLEGVATAVRPGGLL
ncbi:MAG TPA: transcription antitermination factor NusB, partial [Gemmatimonadales bacterium]|nr:transcription antitermination factor NusB [Gemmatimonadales bacterium]